MNIFISVNNRPARSSGIKISIPASSSPSRDLEFHELSYQSTCQRCGCVIAAETVLVPENQGVTCLNCAGLDHLVFIRSGNSTLTRRVVKQFGRRNVVQRIWKHSRPWRSGVMVDQQALDRALCAVATPTRKVSCEKPEASRVTRDREFARKIGILYPGCPANERILIARRVCATGTDRIGRSAAGLRLDEKAIKSAVRAHIRHAHTNFDEFMRGQTGQPDCFRVHERVREEIDAVYRLWLTGATKTEGERLP